jgi:membrane protein DedA with SNARE-associated domain
MDNIADTDREVTFYTTRSTVNFLIFILGCLVGYFVCYLFSNYALEKKHIKSDKVTVVSDGKLEHNENWYRIQNIDSIYLKKDK